jgi:hypothetical protein
VPQVSAICIATQRPAGIMRLQSMSSAALYLLIVMHPARLFVQQQPS